jgi:hypothetical protein
MVRWIFWDAAGYPRQGLKSFPLGHFESRQRLFWQRKFFRTFEHRLLDPPKICALEFKGKIGQSGTILVSATIAGVSGILARA